MPTIFVILGDVIWEHYLNLVFQKKKNLKAWSQVLLHKGISAQQVTRHLPSDPDRTIVFVLQKVSLKAKQVLILDL